MSPNQVPQIIMLGTSFETMGGISSVVNVYRQHKLFDRCGVRYLPTHCDGPALAKLKLALGSFLRFLWAMCFRRPKLVHIHVSSRASFWRKAAFMLVARLARVPYVLHLHGSEFQVFFHQELGRFGQRIVRSAFDQAAWVLVLSSHWQEWARSICSNPHIEAVYNPVSVGGEQPAHEDDALSLLFLGRLGRRKGTYDLLEAVAQLAQTHPSIRLRLGGDGELDGVRQRAQELGIESHIELLGWVTQEAKTDALRHATIYVLPSYHEGLPMSVLEAMAAGLPVVSTPIGGIPEAVEHGVEGLLVEPGSVPELAHSLRQLLDDRGLRERMGQAAYDKARDRFSADRVVHRIERIYAQFGA